VHLAERRGSRIEEQLAEVARRREGKIIRIEFGGGGGYQKEGGQFVKDGA